MKASHALLLSGLLCAASACSHAPETTGEPQPAQPSAPAKAAPSDASATTEGQIEALGEHVVDTCVVADSDSAPDDLRTVLLLASMTDLRAVILTQGVARVAEGARATAYLLGGHSGKQPMLIEGRPMDQTFEPDWLTDERAAGETLYGTLPREAPAPKTTPLSAEAVAKSLEGCKRKVLTIQGPATSAAALGSEVIAQFDEVLVQGGLPSRYDSGFTCMYDNKACEWLIREASGAPERFRFIDVRPDGDHVVEALFTALPRDGLIGRLNHMYASMPQNPGKLWDDLLAIYLRCPKEFKDIYDGPLVVLRLSPTCDVDRTTRLWRKTLLRQEDACD